MESIITTFGEAMIRLAPPNQRRLEQAHSLDVEIGGAELNTAVGLARLGRKVTWLSRLTDNSLGHLIANRAGETGVRNTDILWTDQDRIGVYFLEFGAAPRAASILYDRKDSAMAQIQPGMFDWNRIFQMSKWFYVTGITAALSASAAAATLEALKVARANGVTTILDPNYRAKLWSIDQAADWLTAAVPYVDVLITNPEDIERFLKIPSANVEKGMQIAAERFRFKAIAMTLREVQSVWRNSVTAIAFANGEVLKTKKYDVEIVDRLGTGDAFAAGFIHGLYENNAQKGLDYGIALSALKHSVPGDFPWVTKDEVEGLLEGGGLRIKR